MSAGKAFDQIPFNIHSVDEADYSADPHPSGITGVDLSILRDILHDLDPKAQDIDERVKAVLAQVDSPVPVATPSVPGGAIALARPAVPTSEPTVAVPTVEPPESILVPTAVVSPALVIILPPPTVDVPESDDSTPPIIPIPGPLDHIVVSPDPATVIAGTPQLFIAQGYDAANNPIPGLIFTWGVANGGGMIDNSGLFSAGNTPGIFLDTITATHNAITGTSTVEVVVTTIDHFAFDTVIEPCYVNSPFTATIRALDVNDIPVVTYTGQATLSASAGNVSPATTTNFVNGVWTGNISLDQVANGVTLTALDTFITGTSNSFNVQAAPVVCPCTIWDDATVPAGSVNKTDGQPLETGVRFRSEIDGYVTGIRFYKGALNTGNHIGHLWATDGTMLAEVTFSGETASGWQTAYLVTPVAILANTTYIASYHSEGYYAQDVNYFSAAETYSPPLRALQNGTDGGNGVYRYGPNGSFPDLTWSASNYWVDVVFNTS